MTLCIAAISFNQMVTICDTMISGAIISADATAVKIRPFHQNWAAMIAAEDVTQCLPVIEKAEEYFRNRKNTLAVARVVFKRAYQRHLIEMREDAVLSTYGMTMADFLKNGKRRFTESKFSDLCKKIEDVDPRCEFIVNGFDHQGKPHIFKVNGTGVDSVCDIPGFCCIGSGQWAAEMILYSLKQNVVKSLSETIVNLCAAKFIAEKQGVGTTTFLHARTPTSFTFHYNDGMIEDIRKAWEQRGCPRVPDGLIKAIEDVWHPRCS